MFRKITACATALTLTMVPSLQANAEDQNIGVYINGQEKSLSLNATQGKEDEREILGDAWYYGVVADTFNFNGESETNFAVKSLKHAQGTGGQTGVTDKGNGSRKAFFMAGSVDAPFMVKGISVEVVTPESEKDKFQNSTNSGNPITYTYENAEDINAYVDALENDVMVQSQRLSNLDSFSDYSGLTGSGKITLDITSAKDNTVYINVDKWPELKNQLQQSSGVSVIKNAGQKAVFNFPSDTEVTLQKMSVISGGRNEDTTGLANHSTATGSTATDLIFNMPVATNVSLNDSTGIFLASKADVTCYGVDGGWLIADTFTNNCEWHFINGGLPEEITERKTVITPKREGSVLGARRPRLLATPQTEEKSVETPENKEVTPASSATPKTEESKPEPTPSVTPETKVTPAPESSKPEKEEKETKPAVNNPVPSSTPKTSEETPSSPKPVKTPATEETKSSETPVITPETETSKPEPTPSSTPETKVTPIPESSTPAKEEKEIKSSKSTPVPSSTPAATTKTEKETVSAPKPVETKKAEKKESTDRQVEKKEVGTVEMKNGQPEEIKTEKVVNVPKNSSGHNPVHYAKQVKEAVPVEEKNAKAVRSETPDTSDHSDMNIYSTLLIASGILMIGAVRRMRKEEE